MTRSWDPIRLDRWGAAVRQVIVSRGDPKLESRAGLGRRGVVVPEFQAGWLLTAAGRATRLARRWRATHLMGTGPPFSSLIAAAIAQRRTGLPLLVDYQDSWTIHPDTRYPTRAHAAADRDLERSVWERATKVTVVTSTIARRYGDLYASWTSKIQVLHNGYDPEDLPPEPAKHPGPFTIAYTGSFYPHTPPSTLLAAVERLVKAGKISPDTFQVELVGRPELTVEAEVARRGLQSFVRLRGFRPLREAVETAARADLLYLLIPPHFAEALSDKIFTYLAVGNPILAEVPEGECLAFLKQWADRVAFVPPGDTDRMETAILSSLEAGPLRRADSELHRTFLAEFSRETQALQLSEILEGLA